MVVLDVIDSRMDFFFFLDPVFAGKLAFRLDDDDDEEEEEVLFEAFKWAASLGTMHKISSVQ